MTARPRRRQRQVAISFILIFGSHVLNTFIITAFPSSLNYDYYETKKNINNIMVVEAFQITQHLAHRRRHRVQQQRQGKKDATPIITITMMNSSSSPPPPNDLDTDADNNNNNIDDGRMLDNDDIYNVDSTNNDNNDDDENYYKGATLFGLEPKSYPSSSSKSKNDVLDNTFGMQYTSMVIFVLSCYVTVMLFWGEDVGVTNVV
jgi:hypothetical protein